MLPLSAYLGNALIFMLLSSLQFGWFDDVFDDDDLDDAEDDPVIFPDDIGINPLFDENLYDEQVEGTDGNDVVTAEGPDAQAFFLGAGNDELEGSINAEYAQGGAGNDTLTMREGDDFALGDSGDDFIFGGKGNDTMYGGLGDDDIQGSLGADYLDGGDGNDTLTGGSGNDVVLGGAGDDILSGDLTDGTGGVARGIDDLSGGDGDDTLWLYGEDTGAGGAGADLFRVVNADTPETGVLITDYDASEDMIEVVYTDTTGEPPALSIGAVEDSDDVQILLDDVPVATITGGTGLTAADVVLTPDL